MKLSYSTPSTMYMTSTAASSSSSSLLRLLRKASAAPWNVVWMLVGRHSWLSVASIALTAAPSDTPSARLNETVVAGNCAMWLMSSGRVSTVTLASADRGTWPPAAEGTYREASESI